jgi:hypothetical protein
MNGSKERRITYSSIGRNHTPVAMGGQTHEDSARDLTSIPHPLTAAQMRLASRSPAMLQRDFRSQPVERDGF